MTLMHDEKRHRPIDRRSGPGGWLAAALIIFGSGAALVALLGPLGLGVIEYHASDGAVNQIAGGDVAALLLVAPVSFVAAVLVRRHRVAGFVLAVGPAVYGMYMYTQLALGGDVVRYPGNSEAFFPLFLVLFIAAAAIALGAWPSIEPDHLPRPPRGVERVFGWFSLLVAAFLTLGLHLPGLVDAMSADPSSAEYLADPVVFWLVKWMDLAIVVPALATIGVGVLREAAWARRAQYAAVGWIALLGSSVAGMAVVMLIGGDPGGTVVNAIAFGSFAAIAIVIALLVYRPLFPGTPRDAETVPADRAAGRQVSTMPVDR